MFFLHNIKASCKPCKKHTIIFFLATVEEIKIIEDIIYLFVILKNYGTPVYLTVKRYHKRKKNIK